MQKEKMEAQIAELQKRNEFLEQQVASLLRELEAAKVARCKFCGESYFLAENSDAACAFHAGGLVAKVESGESCVRHTSVYSCCGRPNEAPGCVPRKHAPARWVHGAWEREDPAPHAHLSPPTQPKASCSFCRKPYLLADNKPGVCHRGTPEFTRLRFCRVCYQNADQNRALLTCCGACEKCCDFVLCTAATQHES